MIGTQCNNCEHYFGSLSCEAYPERIPQDILEGTKLHDKIFKDQEGDFIYKPINIEDD